jgi:hypothetical protein
MTAVLNKPSGATRHPARDIDGILKGSVFLAYLAKCAAHDVSAYDALHEAATTIRKGIEKSGKRWAFGFDVKWKAHQITRPLRHAADLHLESAKAYHVTRALFLGAFAEAGKPKAGEFDPTK